MAQYGSDIMTSDHLQLVKLASVLLKSAATFKFPTSFGASQVPHALQAPQAGRAFTEATRYPAGASQPKAPITQVIRRPQAPSATPAPQAQGPLRPLYPNAPSATPAPQAQGPLRPLYPNAPSATPAPQAQGPLRPPLPPSAAGNAASRAASGMLARAAGTAGAVGAVGRAAAPYVGANIVADTVRSLADPSHIPNTADSLKRNDHGTYGGVFNSLATGLSRPVGTIGAALREIPSTVKSLGYMTGLSSDARTDRAREQSLGSAANYLTNMRARQRQPTYQPYPLP